MKTLLLAILLIPGLAMAQAGRFLLAVGDVVVVRGATVLRAGLGAPVESGDTVRVGPASNAQIRMSDESIVGLRSGSVFRIDEYAYSGAADGSEKSIFSLLKGGMRTITGAIGKLQNRDRYAVRTPNATVGIRGTHYTLVECAGDCAPGVQDGTYGGVTDGRIGVTNQAADREFAANEYFHVADANTSPQSLIAPPPFLFDRLEGQQRSRGQQGSESTESMAQSGLNAESRPSDVPAAPAPEPFVVTEKRNEEGTPTVAAEATPVVAPKPGVPSGQPGFSGTVTGLAALSATAGLSPSSESLEHTAECDDLAGCSGSSGITVTFDSSGYQRLDCGSACFIDRAAATTKELGSVPGVIEWGRWSGGPIRAGGFYEGMTFGENQGFHYVVGLPANPMPTSGNGSFTLLGATVPTFSDGVGGGLGTGAMTAGTATVDFLAGTISANMQLAFTGTSGTSNYALAMPSGSFSPGSAGLSGSGSLSYSSGPVNVCGSTACPTSFVGFFAGANASHLGLGYDATANFPTMFFINGVAVMKR